MKQPGKRARVYCGEETSYGTPPSLASTHFMRHTSAQLNFDVLNRVFSSEKKSGPGRSTLFDRRSTGDASLEGLLRPSGTLGTVPECSAIIKAAFGSISNVTLSTTVNVTTAVGGATLTAVTGLAVGGAVLITCPDGKKRVRKITGVSGSAITWAPDLPSGQAPVDTAVVKSAIAYKLTAADAISLFLARYTYQADFTAGLGEIEKGWLIDKLSLMFDYQDEPKFTASGPAKTKADAPSEPGSQTQVGTNPPTAITAEAMISGNAINFMKIGIDLTNGMEVRRDEVGSTAGTEGYRMGDRDISLALDMLAENAYKTAIYDLAMAGTYAAVWKQTGFTEGKIIGLYAPHVEFKPPAVDVPDGAVNWPFKGRCLEATEDANDEIWLALA